MRPPSVSCGRKVRCCTQTQPQLSQGRATARGAAPVSQGGSGSPVLPPAQLWYLVLFSVLHSFPSASPSLAILVPSQSPRHDDAHQPSTGTGWPPTIVTTAGTEL